MRSSTRQAMAGIDEGVVELNADDQDEFTEGIMEVHDPLVLGSAWPSCNF